MIGSPILLEIKLRKQININLVEKKEKKYGK